MKKALVNLGRCLIILIIVLAIVLMFYAGKVIREGTFDPTVESQHHGK